MRNFARLFLTLTILSYGGFGEVLQEFSDVAACQNFFYQGQEPLGLSSANTANICQRLQGVYYYATLYHRLARVPIYSAYILEKSTTSRPDISSSNWYLEPMLASIPQANMLQPSHSTMQPALEAVTESQAVNDDYRNSGLTRGHLNPSQHHSSESQISTFTFTNMAPQESNFNSGTWNQYETFLRDQILPACSQTHVLSGVIISGLTPGQGRWLRDRVNVPTFFWSAFCCVRGDGTRRAEGRLGRNSSPYDVVKMSVPQLEAVLSGEYGGEVLLFQGGCQ
ncbi:endonuclease domain-containing 1 protein-like [Spea bombifrons]|uniref:endonuclease domain-containing 1 protein-like n=1 Tax=Spea bombifrons TaxID=233779 RepID=UPI002349CAC4|nr:endonuclease domain-containing 1 protein-like [Spea bombifrons]